MKKIIIGMAIIIACTISYFAGYNHVIYNQYYEECPHADNCYHIVVDGNTHEYEYATE